MQSPRSVGIATVYRGYNYGSALQAYATREFVARMGYSAQLLGLKSALSRTRNIDVRKLLVMFGRTVLRPRLLVRTVRSYRRQLTKPVNKATQSLFEGFYESELNPWIGTWAELKSYAADASTLACICGSDQIWNAAHAYLDPMYYLRFVPSEKRIAFASSLGRDAIPRYNYQGIRRRLREIPSLSVRERSAVDMLREMTGRTPELIVDPTLLLDGAEWTERWGADVGRDSAAYVLLYFLDTPSDTALRVVERIARKGRYRLLTLLYRHGALMEIEGLEYVDAGPREFVNLVRCADFVFTDSFHGTAFSVNFAIPFYVFDREYGAAESQSARIDSLLAIVGLEDRFVRVGFTPERVEPCDFEAAHERLAQERLKAERYLADAFARIGEGY